MDCNSFLLQATTDNLRYKESVRSKKPFLEQPGCSSKTHSLCLQGSLQCKTVQKKANPSEIGHSGKCPESCQQLGVALLYLLPRISSLLVHINGCFCFQYSHSLSFPTPHPAKAERFPKPTLGCSPPPASPSGLSSHQAKNSPKRALDPSLQQRLQQSLLISPGQLTPWGCPLHPSRFIKGKSRCQSCSKAPARRKRVHVLTSKCILTISSVSELRAELGTLSSARGSFHLTGVTPGISTLPAQSWHTHWSLQSFLQLD